LRHIRRGHCRAVGHAVCVRVRKCRRQTALRRSAEQLQQTHQTRRQQLRPVDGQNGSETVANHRSGKRPTPPPSVGFHGDAPKIITYRKNIIKS